MPVKEAQACAKVEAGQPGQGVVVVAPDLDRDGTPARIVVHQAGQDNALARIVQLTLEAMHRDLEPDLTITITSDLPIARGMGSGAAVSTAIVRALAKHLGHWFPSQLVSDLVYQTEIIHHGTPSGIDNTVIAFEKPVYFVKGSLREVFWVGKPFSLAIADTGLPSPTKAVVEDLRRRYDADQARYDLLFDQVGEIAVAARSAIEQGDLERLGQLMNRNHALLDKMGVSSPALDRLVTAAREGGALGAKLSGAGWGGNMIALLSPEVQGRVDMMLRFAGATNVLITAVS